MNAGTHTVLSNEPGKQGGVDAATANKLTADRDAAPTAVLLDGEGTVGKAYDARTTPNMYVIDGDGSCAIWAPSTTSRQRTLLISPVPRIM